MIQTVIPLPASRRTRGRSAQLGASLLFAMVALAALSLAAAGLVRSASSGALVIGNLGFKTDTAAVTNIAAEQAIAWLGTRTDAMLENDDTPNGYYAAAKTKLDPTGQSAVAVDRELVDWDGDGCSYASANVTALNCLNASPAQTAANATKFSYVITRLCSSAGSLDTLNSCVTGLEQASLGDKSRDSFDYQR